MDLLSGAAVDELVREAQALETRKQMRLYLIKICPLISQMKMDDYERIWWAFERAVRSLEKTH